MTVIRLPWPPRELSPNAREDRRAVSGIRKRYRDAAFYAAKEARAEIAATSTLAIKFFPPDRKRRDLDNMLAAIKSGLDGIALAAGVDDYGWSLSIERADPVKGGAVLVHVADSWRGIGEIAAGMIKGKIE